MNIPGGGKNDIPNRLKRQFAIFNVPLPSVAAINNIFGALVRVSAWLSIVLQLGVTTCSFTCTQQALQTATWVRVHGFVHNEHFQLSASAMDSIHCLVQGRFDPDNFTQEVADVAQKLVPLTVTLWNKVSAKLLPTPAKFHYLFNMRELSKVSCGSIHTCMPITCSLDNGTASSSVTCSIRLRK